MKTILLILLVPILMAIAPPVVLAQFGHEHGGPGHHIPGYEQRGPGHHLVEQHQHIHNRINQVHGELQWLSARRSYLESMEMSDQQINSMIIQKREELRGLRERDHWIHYQLEYRRGPWQ